MVTLRPNQSVMRYDIYRRDASGSDMLVAQYNYEPGITWTDTAVSSGTWGYYYVAVNPNLNVSSTPSALESVTISQTGNGGGGSFWNWWSR